MLVILGWIDRGRATASATASSRSLAGLVHAPGRGRLCHHLISAAEPAAGQHSVRHIVHNIRSGGRPCLSHGRNLHIHINTTGMLLPRLGSSSWSRCRHLSTLCTWNWGQQQQFTYGSAPMAATSGILAR